MILRGKTSQFGKDRVERQGGVWAYAGVRDDPFSSISPGSST